MSFTATPTDGSTPPIPMSSVVPDGTNTPVALEGGPSVVTGGNTVAPASMYVKDGNDVAKGTTTDAAWSGSGAGTEIALLKKLVAQLAATLQVNVQNSTPLGQATMAASSPVVIASNQSSVSVNATTAADTAIGGTTAPSKELLVAGKTNDATPQYQPIPEGTGGRSVIVEGVTGGIAVKTDGSAVTQPVSNTAAGAPGDSAATNTSSSWSMVSLLKGMLAPLLKLNGSGLLYVDVGQSTGSLGVFSNGGSLTVRNLGNSSGAVAAGATADTTFSTVGGYLCGVVVTSTGTAAVQLFDNSATGSGKPIAYIPSGGTGWFPFPVPVSNGITLKGSASNPAMTVVWFQ